VASNLPCAVEPLTRAERLVSDVRLVSEGTHRIRVRGRTDLSAAQRAVVTYRDTGLTEIFEVEAITRGDDRGRETHAYVTQVQA
jgi:head-tail adaptor